MLYNQIEQTFWQATCAEKAVFRAEKIRNKTGDRLGWGGPGKGKRDDRRKSV